MASRATPKLVVDAATLMSLSAEHVEATEINDRSTLAFGLFGMEPKTLVVEGLAFFALRVVALGTHITLSETLRLPPRSTSTPRPAMLVGDRDRAQAPRLGNYVGLAVMLLGVENLMRNAALLKRTRELLGFLYRDRADQHRLTRLVTSGQIFDAGRELAIFALVDQVGLVISSDRTVGGNRDHLQPVGANELPMPRSGRYRSSPQVVCRVGSSSEG